MHREVPRKAVLPVGGFTFLPLDHFGVSELSNRAEEVVLGGALRPAGKNEGRYLSYLAGRAAVGLLFRAFGLSFKVLPDSQWGYLRVVDESGAPRSDVYVNLSHTLGVAVASVMPRPVGIDVERVTRSAQRVMKRMATEEEISRLPESVSLTGGTVPSQILLWSGKEAVSKATGLGIKFGLKHFQIDLRGSAPFDVRIDVEGPQKLRAPVLTAFRREDFVVSICSEKTCLIGHIEEISP